MQIFNLLLASLGSAMSVVVLVVVLIHYLYLDMKPSLVRDIPGLWLSAGIFALIGAVAWGCVWARARRHAYRHWFELTTLGCAAGGITVLIAVFR